MVMRGLVAMTPNRLALGLALGLALTAAAGRILVDRTLDEAESTAAMRSAIIGIQGVVAGIEAAELDEGDLTQRLAELDASDPELSSLRVIRFAGLRLLASTAREAEPAPRRLARDEKPVFDLGQVLRANVEANAAEGRAWKPELSIEPDATGTLSLAAPLRDPSGVVIGAVFATADPVTPEARPAFGWALLLVLVAAPPCLLLVASRIGAAPALLAVLSMLALIGVSVTFDRLAGHAVDAGRLDIESAVALRLDGVSRAVAASSGVVLAADDLDVDELRRARGVQGPEGPRLEVIEAATAEAKQRLRTQLLAVAVLAFVLAAVVGLGGAGAVLHTLATHRQAYLLVAPALVTMLLLVFGPFFYGITLSFTEQSIYNTDKALDEIWVGFENFRSILSDFEVFRSTAEGHSINYQNFYWTLGFTVVWTVTNVAIGVSVGLGLALLLNNRGLALTGFYRVALILPWAMPNYITALIWKGMFHSQFGVINQVVQIFGGDPISWFESPFTSFLTVLSTNGWLSFPFMMVISLGALQSIPSDLYEAAQVDGASRWQRFRAITLPSLKPALVPAVILSVVWTFNMFNIIFLVSEGQPGGATEILITEAYKIAFEQYRYGYAAAYSTIIFLILLGYGVWQNRVTKAAEGL
jgi:arabinogalactan oligomer/maltooligosaccharide transport system permease protein